MTEFIEILDLNGSFIRAESKSRYYAGLSHLAHGRPRTKVKAVHVLLLNSKGEVYLQSRCRLSTTDPGILDKTVGGHVRVGETYDLAAVRECGEELGIPIAIFPLAEFHEAALNIDTATTAVVRPVAFLPNYWSFRFINGKRTLIARTAMVYIGYYDGNLKMRDTGGVVLLTPAEIKEAAKTGSRSFSSDIIYLLDLFQGYLHPKMMPVNIL